MYVEACDLADPRQRFEFLPVSSDEVLIRAWGEDRCFARDNYEILLDSCREELHTQRWWAVRGGFNSARFELSQKTLPDRCVNQDHHPKSGEVMRMYECEAARKPEHSTSFWNLY